MKNINKKANINDIAVIATIVTIINAIIATVIGCTVEVPTWYIITTFVTLISVIILDGVLLVKSLFLKPAKKPVNKTVYHGYGQLDNIAYDEESKQLFVDLRKLGLPEDTVYESCTIIRVVNPEMYNLYNNPIVVLRQNGRTILSAIICNIVDGEIHGIAGCGVEKALLREQNLNIFEGVKVTMVCVSSTSETMATNWLY